MKKAEADKSYSWKDEEKFYRAYRKAKKERGKAMARKAKYVPCGWVVEYRVRSRISKRWRAWRLDTIASKQKEPAEIVKRWLELGEQAHLVRVYRKVEK